MGSPPLTAVGQPKPLQDGEFVNASFSDVVSWLFKEIEPPSPVYITRDDQIAVSVFTSSAGESVTVNGRLLTIDNIIMPFKAVITPTSVGVASSKVITGVEGFLLSISVTPSQATQRGVTFIRAWINRGLFTSDNIYQLLISNYGTISQPATWPNGSIGYPREGAGELTSETITNPAAGAEFTWPNITSNDRNVFCINAQLVTSVVVANRNVQVLIKDASSRVVYQASASVSIPASTTASVTFTTGQIVTQVVTTNVIIPLPQPCMLPSGFRISTLTANIQAADQWSGIVGSEERWVAGG